MTSHLSIYQLFEQQAKAQPEMIAVQTQESQVRYGDLQARVNGLTRVLADQGVTAGEVVALSLLEPVEMVTAILAVLKLGAVYLPVSGFRSVSWMADIIEKDQVMYLITDGEMRLPVTGVQLVDLSQIDLLSCAGSMDEMEQEGVDEQPCAIYHQPHLSGQDVGLVISKGRLAGWIQFTQETLGMNVEQTFYLYSTRMWMQFPLWLANLTAGGRVYFYPKPGGEIEGLELARVQQVLSEGEFTSLVCPLAELQALQRLESQGKEVLPSTLCNIVTLGEKVYDLKELKLSFKERGIRWHNYFGFPEISMITTIGEDEKLGLTHLGRLTPDLDGVVLDQAQQLLPVQVTGELYTCGRGNPLGYQSQTELQVGDFVNLPGISEEQFFKTGYRGTWLQDWKLAIQVDPTGRMVDVHGLRIGLQDVERALLAAPQVREAAVLTPNIRKGMAEVGRLTAYILLNNQDQSLTELETFIRQHLPEDIFPIGFVVLAQLPRTEEGLVDEQALAMLPILDHLEREQLQQDLERLPAIERAGVVLTEQLEMPTPIHIRDLLPTGNLGETKQMAGSGQTDQVTIQGQQEMGGKLALVDGGELILTEDEPADLCQVLGRAAEEYGDEEVITIHSDSSVHTMTYRGMLEKAERVLTGIRKLGLQPQDMAILHYDKTEDYFSAFWGCTLAGVIPVPIQVPKVYARESNEVKAMGNIWKMCGEPVVLTTAGLHGQLAELYPEFRLVNIEDLIQNQRSTQWHQPDPADICVMLFTSGSTGMPKGVTQSHQNIIARQRSTVLFYDLTQEEVSFNWLPVEHVVGLFLFHIKEVYLGCKQIHASTELILADPLKWIDLLSEYQVTMAWAPNFAFGVVSEAIEKYGTREWDLSHLTLISNCGETVNADTCKRFLKLLKPFHLPQDAMKPEWGMSETCSCVLGLKTFTSDSESVSYVSLGVPYPGVSFRIVDGKNQLVNEGVVGRLQIKGIVVTPGYYNNPTVNAECFVGDGWFDTGDLGYIANGEVTFTGRAKDVIIINGINYNNNEIEAIVEELDDVENSFTVACAVQEGGKEKLVIFFHTPKRGWQDVLELIPQIRQIVNQRVGLNVDYVIPVEKEEVPKTSIGKLQRTKMINKFAEGEYLERIKKIDIGFGNQNTIPAWFYRQSWKRQSVPMTGQSPAGSTLIFCDQMGLGEGLEAELSQRGVQVVLVQQQPGVEFAQMNLERYQVQEGSLQDYQQLWNVLKAEGIRVAEVIYATTYDLQQEVEVSSARAEAGQKQGLISLVQLIRAFAMEQQRVEEPRDLGLTVITAQAQRVDPTDQVDYLYGGLAGLVKTVAQELPWLTCTYLDLDGDDLMADVSNVLTELCNPKADLEVAYRKGQRYIPLLTPIEMQGEAQGQLPVQTGGIYLVTGGLGGIGTYVTKWLIQNYQAKIIAVGRRELPDLSEWDQLANSKSSEGKLVQRYQELSALSADFVYHAGDLSDEAFVLSLGEVAKERWGHTFDGVFHLAGIGNLQEHWADLEGHRLINEEVTTFHKMAQAKVYGTLHLHQLVADRPDTLFVAFSSVHGCFGASTFGAYAAANDFLDHFCAYRLSHGYPHTYWINWSTWDQTGMSENISMQLNQAKGLELLTPLQGIASLIYLLERGAGQTIVGIDGYHREFRRLLHLDQQPKQVLHLYYQQGNEAGCAGSELELEEQIQGVCADREMLVQVHQLDQMPLTEEGQIDEGRLVELAQAGSSKVNLPENELEEQLFSLWQEILGHANFGTTDRFFEVGGHSLNATTLMLCIHKEFDVKLTLVDLFQYATIKQQAIHISTGQKSTFLPLTQAEPREYYPLSPAQNRLYVVNQLDQRSLAYNMTSVNLLHGQVDEERLERAFQTVIERHESLRTSFVVVDGIPMQKIHQQVPFQIECLGDGQQGVEELVPAFVQPFDLTQAPLMRVGLVQQGLKPDLLIVDLHHIITDGLSSMILLEEVVAVYNQQELPPMKFQYKDYSQWQAQLLAGDSLKGQEEYWLKQMAGELPLLELPLDYSRPTVQKFTGDDLYFAIDGELYDELKALMAKTETTLYMALLAVCNILLSKYAGQEDIIIGSPVAGRNHADLARIIGMFVGQVAHRNQPIGEKTFIEFLSEVKTNALLAFANQDYQFHELVKKLGLQGTQNRHPLYDVVFAVEDRFTEIDLGEGLDVIPVAYSNQTSKTDLRFGVIEEEDRVLVKLTYCTALFKRKTCEKMGERFVEIVQQICANPELKISEIVLSHSLQLAQAEVAAGRDSDFDF